MSIGFVNYNPQVGGKKKGVVVKKEIENLNSLLSNNAIIKKDSPPELSKENTKPASLPKEVIKWLECLVTGERVKGKIRAGNIKRAKEVLKGYINSEVADTMLEFYVSNPEVVYHIQKNKERCKSDKNYNKFFENSIKKENEIEDQLVRPLLENYEEVVANEKQNKTPIIDNNTDILKNVIEYIKKISLSGILDRASNEKQKFILQTFTPTQVENNNKERKNSLDVQA